MNKQMLQGLRKCGIKFESFIEAKLDERSKILSDFYAVKTIQSEEKINDRLTKVVSRDLAYIKDLTEFLSFVMDFRAQNYYCTFVRVGINSGGDSLKVICNIFKPEKVREDDMGDRGTYSGINGSVALAYADNLQETHDNLLQIVESINLHECKYSLASDMKLICILLGISMIGIYYIARLDRHTKGCRTSSHA
ncbi:uncharacterized protein LOC136075340 [Hydra vulgaris]|uniref:Uncharacterized protein LOC136075340 n=1 Tax=Hydra vulgaris TaxID=6087 RepID=A0ABM4B5X0_HYDVU